MMKETNDYNKDYWERTTIIKDIVHGYIKIPKPIVKEIIDSEQFQRLKDIEQTGMEALYPSATHKRFTHSLGVYHLSQKAYVEFRNNVAVSYLDIYEKLINQKVHNPEEVWARWGLLFQLASLLHDCGHSPFSHTLEFIYDLAEENEEKDLNKKLIARMSERFKIDMQETKAGKPHERMSALYIATDSYSGLRGKIEKLLKSYIKAYEFVDIYENDKDMMDDDIEFMVRMVIGCRYGYKWKDEYPQREKYDEQHRGNWYIELQLRNCLISMLNSQLDVDNLDYVIRDSKLSGYANHAVDVERLLSSFTIVRAFQVHDMEIDFKDEFDYCINLEKFRGHKLEGRLAGQCRVFCQNCNISAHGRIALKNQQEKSDAKRRIYQTTDDFSAELKFENEKGALLEIVPSSDSKRDYAYIHFKGKMEGTLSGTVFVNEGIEKAVNWYKKGELKIYFAYEQKCMSVLMSAIYNSNFEKKWIYAHHITTYTNEFLYIYLLEKYAEYVVRKRRQEMIGEFQGLFAHIKYQRVGKTGISKKTRARMTELRNSLQQEIEDEKLYTRIEKCNKEKLAATNNVIRELMILCNELSDDRDEYREKFYLILKECCEGALTPKCLSDANMLCAQKIVDRYKRLLTAEMQVFSDILAMYEPYEVDGLVFYKTCDRDLLAAYKHLYMQIGGNAKKCEKEYKEFAECYEELTGRKYLKCMWKSQPEFEYYFSDWTDDEIKMLRNQLKPAKAPKRCSYIVLSDNISHQSIFLEKFWKYLKNEYAIERFVCIPQQIRTKKFVDYEMYMKRGYRVLRLKDVKLFNDDQQNFDFFYFYYKQSNPQKIDVFNMLAWLKNEITGGRR